MKMSIIQEKVNKLPRKPGIYEFLAKNGEILYIGKATSLRERVWQYFSGTDVRGERIFSMVEQIADIQTIETDSVLEALILESNLIKKHQPKYNVQEKDDKSFSYAVITKEEFPRVLILRKTKLQNPIPKLLLNLPLRKGERYKEGVVFGPYTSKKSLEVALNIIRKIFPYHSSKQKTEKGCLDFQIGKCPGPYAGAISKKDYLKNIRGIKMILEGKKKTLVKKLEKEMKALAKIHEFEKAGEARNKIFALNHIRDIALISSEPHPTSILPLKRGGSKGGDLRIEAFDISNISGEFAVGSMVVFENDEPNKSEYRKFKIKTVEGANDVGMMAEVLFRRFRHALTPLPTGQAGSPSPSKGEGGFWPKPDLILLDGGKGHLNMAEKIIEEFNLQIPLMAVAKGPTRKKLDLRYGKVKSENKLDENLIKQIMDEAHRFAITYHRKVRKKNFIDKK